MVLVASMIPIIWTSPSTLHKHTKNTNSENLEGCDNTPKIGKKQQQTNSWVNQVQYSFTPLLLIKATTSLIGLSLKKQDFRKK